MKHEAVNPIAEVSVSEEAEEEDHENWSEIPLYSVENITDHSNNTSSSSSSSSKSQKPVSQGKSKALKGQLEEFGRSFRRLFGIDTKRPKPIQETIPVAIRPSINSTISEQDESIDLMPIEKRQSISKPKSTDGDRECLENNKEKLLFTTLSSPEAWKADQQLMAVGKFALPPVLTERYELLHLIGEGSFGFVWAAKRVDDGEDVAIKFAHRERIADEANWITDESGHRVLREVAMLQSLGQHPSIIKLIEWHEVESYIVIITERFGTPWTWPNPRLDHRRNEGLRPAEQLLAMRSRATHPSAVRAETPSDLFECIESHYYMPESTVYRVFSQLLEVVLYLCHRGILHRDLKDENILVDEAYRIKLIDFGSAARIPVSTDGAEDYYRQFNGTLAFSAPEIVKGLWYKGTLAEVWTLGILLYTLRWRRSPFPDCRAILEGEPAELDDRPTDCIGDALLKQMLRRMLEKRPSRRIPLDQVASEPWLRHCHRLYDREH